MRRSRRGGRGGGGMEFGGSGEDSFVAVVVTKLTGALLFILLLTMVIMALIPKAIDQAKPSPGGADAPKLAIVTPPSLPEAIAGRPYAVALAANGGQGPLTWSVQGELPEGIALDSKTGILGGTAKQGASKPIALTVAVGDGLSRATATTSLSIYKPDAPLGFASKFKPSLPPVPWRAWAENGFGFLVLALVGVIGLNAVGDLERRLGMPSRRRFLAYRMCVGGATLLAAVALAVWLWKPPFQA